MTSGPSFFRMREQTLLWYWNRGQNPDRKYVRSVRCGIRPYLCDRSEEHTSELQSLMRISYAVFRLKKKKTRHKKKKELKTSKHHTSEDTQQTNHAHRTLKGHTTTDLKDTLNRTQEVSLTQSKQTESSRTIK